VTGWLSTAQSVNGSTTVSNLAFLYDYMGNVTQRQDVKQSLTETLCYDNDYRLTQTYAGTGTCTGSSPTLQIQYASNGNITSRSDVAGGATWAYGSTQPHAVTQAGSSSYVYGYDANGNATSRQGSSIAYSSYNYPTALSAGSGSTAESVTLSYGPDRQRWQQNYSGNPTSEITNYVGGLFEVVYYNGGVINYRHYINAGGENVAVYSRENNGTDTYYYLVSDHQGSVASITSSAGSQDFGESYTPFGNRRNPSTWADPPPQYTGTDLTASAAVTRQGYTFQTQLGLWMGMNHMNGRVEDSITGRMISADPFVPDPTNSQSYNRYSYVLNNPVTLSDPSGFIDCTAQVDAVQGDYQNFPCTQNDDPPLTGPTIWGWPLPLEDPANPQPSSMEGGYCGGNNTNCPDSSQQLVNNNYEYGTLHTVTVQANRCTPPPISTLADRTYDPFDPSTHNYQVQSLAGYQMTPAQRQALFNGWRNGLNAAPGIAPNTPDATPVLLANVPFTPDTNWIYLRTNPSNLTWTNVTLPGHYFYPGTVVNSVVTDAAGFTWLVTTGTGATGRWFQNDVLGSAFFKLSQGEAITRFYGGGPMVRMGSAGSCN
jgi:RHS repeat-associated protein